MDEENQKDGQQDGEDQQADDKLTQLEQKAAELEAKLKEKEEQIAKLSNKDLNFTRFKDKTEAEVNEMKKKMTEKEKMLTTELYELTKERQVEKEKSYNEAKQEILNSLSKGDKDLAKRIEDQADSLAGEAVTASELEERLRKGFILAQGELPRANPIFSGYSPSYRDPNNTEKRFSETVTGKESITKWFPELAAKIYKDKK